MALNLDKQAAERIYYYSVQGVVFGPVSITTLLQKIDPETLVYRDGIEWTQAAELEELNKYFHKIVSPVSVDNLASTEVSKKQRSSSIAKNTLVLLFVLSSTGTLIYLLKDGYFQTKTSSTPVETFVVMADPLSEFDVYDVNAVRLFKPDDIQIALAEESFALAQTKRNEDNLVDAINLCKKALTHHPKAESYLFLSELYLSTLDFHRSLECLRMAQELDYQPKSELDERRIEILAIKGDHGATLAEVNNIIRFNPILLDKVHNDFVFLDFRKSEFYLQLIEKDRETEALSDAVPFGPIIQRYFESVNRQSLDAHIFYADTVEQFINLSPTTPDEINEVFRTNDEFLNGNAQIIGPEFYIEDFNTRTVWINYSCFRASKNKHQNCRIKVEIVFNDFSEIISYKEVKVMDLVFTDPQ